MTICREGSQSVYFYFNVADLVVSAISFFSTIILLLFIIKQIKKNQRADIEQFIVVLCIYSFFWEVGSMIMKIIYIWPKVIDWTLTQKITCNIFYGAINGEVIWTIWIAISFWGLVSGKYRIPFWLCLILANTILFSLMIYFYVNSTFPLDSAQKHEKEIFCLLSLIVFLLGIIFSFLFYFLSRTRLESKIREIATQRGRWILFSLSVCLIIPSVDILVNLFGCNIVYLGRVGALVLHSLGFLNLLSWKGRTLAKMCCPSNTDGFSRLSLNTESN